MSSPRWTAEQQAAIDLKGQILVAAAAGSGKTAVLVERLIRRIMDPHDGVDVDRFLVVTFTKAAANEMRERVGKALDDALFKETDPVEVERLLHQRALLYRASITTLHSFCMELIRQYFYQLDLDPAFRVADEAEADLLRQDTLEDLFEAYYERENPAFQALVDAFGTDRDDQPLMEQVLRLYEFAISQVHPLEWLGQLHQAYEWSSVEELVQSPWGKAARQGLLDKVEESITLIERAYQIATQPLGPLQYADILQDDLSRLKLLERTLRDGTWAEIEARFQEAVSFPRLPQGGKKGKGKGKKADPESISGSDVPEGLPRDEKLQKSLREESKKSRDEAKKKLDKLKEDLFSFPLADQLPRLKEMSELVQTLATVVQEFAAEYAAAKRLRNIVDFSDLEHFALRLLEDEEKKPSLIAGNLQEHYAEVLVDEYQDINPVQERILQLVSRENGPQPNLFMVGDVKQSIYRFRMADPSLFLKKYTELPHWQLDQQSINTFKQPTTENPTNTSIIKSSGKSNSSNLSEEIQESQNSHPEPTGKKLVIDLNRNFRSRREVIEGVNFIFRQIMTEGAGEIAYNDQAALRYGADYVENPELKTAEGPIELHLFDPKAIKRAPGSFEVSEAALANPLERTVPVNPVDPANPMNSANPTNTADKANPAFPVNPVSLSEPLSTDSNVFPSYLVTEPSESMDSSEPADPDPDENSTGSSDEPSLEELEAARIEARLVALRIQKMVQGKEFQVYDRHLNDFRPVQYSDIVILMRSFSSVAPVYVEEFQNAGIPVYAETSSGYFGASEVETILSLLKVIDNPRLDIPLAAVLRSPLVGLNGTELGKLRSLLPNSDFYETIVLAYWASLELSQEDTPSANPLVAKEEFNPPSNSSIPIHHDMTSDFNITSDPIVTSDSDTTQHTGRIPDPNLALHSNIPVLPEIIETLKIYEKSLPQLLAKAKHILKSAPELQRKVKSFWPKLQAWRHLSRRTSLADLLWHLYEETGYLAYVGTLPSGIQRQANLRVLYDRACRYEATNYRGLFRFLRFLEKFQGQGKDLGSARALGENENVVRLITVHSSKGLEFPVVFMIGLGTKFNTRSLTGRLLLHSELGAGIPLMDLDNQVRYPSFIQYAVKQRLWQESLAEELRILYVALTRAKERLLLYGSVGKLEDVLHQWQRLATSSSEEAFSDGQLRRAKTFLDWIGPALARHPYNVFGNESPFLNLHLPDDTSKWEVYIHATLDSEIPDQPIPNQPISEKTIIEENPAPTPPLTPEQYLKEVEIRFDWKYPYPDAVTQTAKTSVSELKRRFTWHTEDTQSQTMTSILTPVSTPTPIPTLTQTPTPTPNVTPASTLSYTRPKFIQTQKELTPAERGIALHTVMQHLPLGAGKDSWTHLDPSEKEHCLTELLESLVRREILTHAQATTVSPRTIQTFLDSPLGMRLLKGEDVRRELPFTLSLNLRNHPEPVLIQGVIDALILSRTEGTAEVIDFKTDNLQADPHPEATLIERYALQLALYSLAVERLLNLTVKQGTIYSVPLGLEVKISNEIMQARLKNIIEI